VFLCIHIHAPPVWPLPTPLRMLTYVPLCACVCRSCVHGERVYAACVHHVRRKHLQTLGFFSDANCYVISCHGNMPCDRGNSGSDAKNAMPMLIFCHKNTHPIVAWWLSNMGHFSASRIVCASLAHHTRATRTENFAPVSTGIMRRRNRAWFCC